MKHASFAPRAAAAASCAALALLALPGAAGANGRFPAAGQIVISPVTPSTLLVRATYGLLYSTNAGQGWGWICEPAVGFNSEEDPEMGFTGDGTLLAGIFEGMAVSHDGGCDWSFATGGLEGRYVIDLSVDKMDPSQAVLVITNNVGTDDAGSEIFVTQIWQTADNGQTWAQAGTSLDPELLALTIDVAPSDQSRVYISGRLGPPSYPGVIERSDDRGATWTALPIPGADDTNLPYIGAVDPNNEDIVYVRLNGSPSDQLIVTTDGGMTWSTLYTSMGPLLGFALSPDGSTFALGGPMDPLQTAPTSTMALGVASMDNVLCLTWDASGLYACADEFLQGFTAGKSTDEGKTFTPIMHLAALCGPLDCPATSSVSEQCPPLWQSVAATIDAQCTGGGGAGRGLPVLDGGIGRGRRGRRGRRPGDQGPLLLRRARHGERPGGRGPRRAPRRGARRASPVVPPVMTVRGSWAARLAGSLFALIACLAIAGPARAAGWLVRSGREDQVKALFGDAWGGAIGPYRVTRGRILPSSVVVSLIASGRSATIRIEHPDDAPSAPDPGDAFTLRARDKGIAVTATCAPACSAADATPLREVAEQIVARYTGDLFVPARAVASAPIPGPAGDAPGTAHAAETLGPLDGWTASLALFAVSAVLAAIALARRLRSRQRGVPRLLPDMALVFAGTIALCWLLTEPGMSNWYLDFLPAAGRAPPLGDRLGAGALVFELPFRAILPWTDRTLYGVTLVVGAGGAAFFYAAFRALALPRATCLAAMALFASSPLGARALWSGSVHVVVFALFALLLFAWLRAQEEGRDLEAALALAIVPTLGLARAEAIVFAAVPLVWGLAREGWKRRIGLAAIYAAVLAASAWIAWRLVVLPSGSPLPGEDLRAFVAQRLLADLGLFGRLFHVDEGPNWFPLPLAVLATAGAALLAVRRPSLLAKTLVTLALPQIVLGRFVNDEGLVGCRYFLPVLPLLSLLAAAPLGPLAVPRRWGRARAIPPAAALAFVAAEAATVLAAWPMYHYRYTFQEEYRFLRAQLAEAPAPCRVYHLAVDDDPVYRADPDCCLSPRRSLLTLALPGVDFEPLGVEDDGGFRVPDERCAYYFESAICSYGPTLHTESRNPTVSAKLRDACRRLAADPRLEPVASATVPAHTTWRFFAEDEVHLRLSKLRPARRITGE